MGKAMSLGVPIGLAMTIDNPQTYLPVGGA